jgi:hypothetical protein
MQGCYRQREMLQKAGMEASGVTFYSLGKFLSISWGV